MKEREIVIKRRSSTIRGVALVPEKKSSRAVVFVHGFRSNWKCNGIFSFMGKRFCKMGFYVYSFDFSYAGTDPLERVKGEFLDAVQYARKRHKSVFVLAHSMGSAVCIIAKPRIEGMILMGAVARPKDMLIRLFSKTGEKRNNMFWDKIKKHKPLKDVISVSCPLFLIHGTKDRRVPVSESASLFAAARCKKRIKTFETGHFFAEKRKEIFNEISQWIEELI